MLRWWIKDCFWNTADWSFLGACLLLKWGKFIEFEWGYKWVIAWVGYYFWQQPRLVLTNGLSSIPNWLKVFLVRLVG